MIVTAEESVLIPCDRETVFAYAVTNACFKETLHSFGPIPGIADGEMLDGAALATGARRRMTLLDGTVIDEDITDFTPSVRHCYRWASALQPPFAWLVRAGDACWEFTDADGGTRIRWRYAFELTTPLVLPLAVPVTWAFRGWQRRGLERIREVLVGRGAGRAPANGGSGAPQAEAYGPEGDASRHVPREELERRLAALPAAPRDQGRLTLLVRRRADGVRETPEAVELTPDVGLPGDRWQRQPPRDPVAQLAVMQHGVAELIANGQPLTVFGDNVFLDLDLSNENLAIGSRVRIGSAVLEVTPKPHNGCRKFLARFGSDALRFVSGRDLRHRNLRGIYLQVVEAGVVRCGDVVDVVSRPAAAAHSR